MYKVVGTQGEELANADSELIHRWILEGRIQPDTQVVDPIYGHARPAVQIPELEETFRKRNEWIQSQALNPPVAQTPPVPRPHHYPQGQGQAPYQVIHRPKSKAAAFILCFFLGFFGLHQFYLGNTAWGAGHLMATFVLGPLTCFASYAVQAIVLIVEAVLILSGQVKDSHGQPLI